MMSRKPGKNTRRTQILAGILTLAALTAGIVILLVLPPPGADPSVSPPISVPPPSPGFVLIDESPENVASVRFTSGGAAYTVTRSSAGEFTLTGVRPVFPVYADKLSLIFSLAISQTYVPAVLTDAGEASITEFGLDSPILSWRIQNTDGSFREFELGIQSATLSGHYVRESGTNDVYMLGMGSAEILLWTIDDLYDLRFLPAPIGPGDYENPTYELITRVALRYGDRDIEFSRRTEEDFADATLMGSSYLFTRPTRIAGRDGDIESYFLMPLTTVSPSSAVETNPADLSVYGLDNPARLTVSTKDWTGVLLIGKQNADRTGRYVMREGLSADVVLLDRDGDYSFLDLPYYRMRTSLIWLHSLSDVSEVVLELDGTTHMLAYQSLENDHVSAQLDGVVLDEEDAKDAYIALLSVTVGGERDGKDAPGRLEYRLTMKMLSGETHVLALYYLNDRQLSYTIDGVDENLYVLRTVLQSELLSKITALLER